jgi:streptogramin lyase
LISSETGIFRVPESGGKATKVADVPSSPILPAPGGVIYYGFPDEIGRIAPGARTGTRLPVDVIAPHAIVFAPDGDLVVSDTGNNRIVRIDPSSGQSSVLAAGLRAPVGMVAGPGGTFLVLELEAGALTSVDASGRTSSVVTGLDKPYALTRAADGMVYVIQVGDSSPPTGRIERVASDGSVAGLPLIRP